MNIDEIIDALEKHSPDETSELGEAIGSAIEMLKKEMLRKPCEWCDGNVSKYFDTNWYDFTAENTGVRPKAKFCPNCGQKLDWED